MSLDPRNSRSRISLIYGHMESSGFMCLPSFALRSASPFLRVRGLSGMRYTRLPLPRCRSMLLPPLQMHRRNLSSWIREIGRCRHRNVWHDAVCTVSWELPATSRFGVALGPSPASSRVKPRRSFLALHQQQRNPPNGLSRPYWITAPIGAYRTARVRDF